MNLAMLRIALLGSRSAWGRLAGIAAGVAIGTAMFILLLGAYKGLDRRDDRYAFLKTTHAEPLDGQGTLTDTNAFFAPVWDYFGDDQIDRYEIAITPNTLMTIPGISRLPGPGEYLASPALEALIESTPADELSARYGTSIGTIPDSLLESPDSLMVIVGRTGDQLLAMHSASSVSDFSVLDDGAFQGAYSYRIIVIIGAIGMFFPVLLFISIVTQLGAVQRQERFASLRLIGASSQTVSWFAAAETALTSGIGAIAGVAIAIAFRPFAADAKIDGKHFFESDFAVGTPTIVAATLGMVIVSTLAAAIKIRRTGVSPINTVRDIRETPPSFWRGVPLLAGLSMVGTATMLVRTNETGGNGILTLFVGGFLLILLGIVFIGPFLTLMMSRLLTRLSGSAPALIASRRISATPSATFRSVSGLVVAVFIVTVFAGSASAIADEGELSDGPGVMSPDTLMVQLGGGPPSESVASLQQAPESEGVDPLQQVSGVEGIVLGKFDPTAARNPSPQLIVSHADAELLGFTNIPESDYVSFSLMEFTNNDASTPASLSSVTVSNPESLMTQVMFVITDGSPASIERVRTALSGSQFEGLGLTRVNIARENSNEDVEELKVLAYLGVILSILIAGSSLAIATACAMLDRKRVLGLMRLMGMPESNLQKIVAIEAAVPLLAVLGVVIALGFGVAWCIVEGTSDFSIGIPDRYYFLSIGFGLLTALGMIALTFGLIRKNTLVTATRFE